MNTFRMMIMAISMLLTPTAYADHPADPLLGFWVVDYESIQDSDLLQKSRLNKTFLSRGIQAWSMYIVEFRIDSIVYSRDVFGMGMRTSCEYELTGKNAINIHADERITAWIPIKKLTIVDDDHIVSHVHGEDWSIDLPLRRIFRSSPTGARAQLPKALTEALQGEWTIDEVAWDELNKIHPDSFQGPDEAFDPRWNSTIVFDEQGQIVCTWVEGERLSLWLRDFDRDQWLCAVDHVSLANNKHNIGNTQFVDLILLISFDEDGDPILRINAYSTPLIRVDDIDNDNTD